MPQQKRRKVANTCHNYKITQKTAECVKNECMNEFREILREQNETIRWLTEEGSNLRLEIERLKAGGRASKRKTMATDPLFDLYGE